MAIYINFISIHGLAYLRVDWTFYTMYFSLEKVYLNTTKMLFYDEMKIKEFSVSFELLQRAILLRLQGAVVER